MNEPINNTSIEPAPKVKTSVKVIVLILAILGILGTLCGLAVGVFYTILPAEVIPVGTPVSQMRLGGIIISSLIVIPGIFLLIVALCLWFFLWYKK
jgi:hypothetical protein